ncbi:MAG: transposase [Pseudomonadota bacterium]
MARKRYSDEDILKLLREIELHLAGGSDVATACRAVGVSDATYYNWRKKFGSMGRSQLSELKALEKENQRLSYHEFAQCHVPFPLSRVGSLAGFA